MPAILDRKQPTLPKFNQLAVGVIFEYGCEVYIKSLESALVSNAVRVNAVELVTGRNYYFTSDDLVQPLKDGTQLTIRNNS